jgi:hypothetical protein
MRIHAKQTLVVGLVAIAVAGIWGGCTATPPTELVPAVLSQVQVPRNLAAIEIAARVNGAAPSFCQTYTVSNGMVNLPSTLGFIPGATANATVDITVRGYENPNPDPLLICDETVSPESTDGAVSQGPRVLRRSIQTYTPGHELFVPMPLSYSCFDTDCSSMGTNATCKGAQCVDGTQDAGSLIDFVPNLVYGTEEPCFHATQCFSDAVPAVALDPDNCIYGFLEGFPPGQGLNVRVYYRDLLTASDTTVPSPAAASHSSLVSAGEVEILSNDATEGFTVTTSNEGGPGRPEFQLAPGLCKLAKQASSPPSGPDGGLPSSTYKAITDIQVASACPPKAPLLPICAGDRATISTQNLPGGPAGSFTADGKCNVPRQVLPSPTAIYMLIDDTQYLQGNSDAGTSAFAQVALFAQFLKDPVFARTYFAFRFLTHDGCTPPGTGYLAPAEPQGNPFELAAATAGDIANALALKAMNPLAGDTVANPLPLDLQPALELNQGGAYGLIKNAIGNTNPGAYNTLALMVFVDRGPNEVIGSNPTDCTPPIVTGATNAEQAVATEAAAAFAQGIKTSFAILNNPGNDAAQTVVPAYQRVASMSSGAVSVIDVTTQSQTALFNFATYIEPLATCLYDAPADITSAAGVTLDYTNPVTFADTTIPEDPTCTATASSGGDAGGPNGWSLEPIPGSNGAGHRFRVCGQYCADLRNTVFQVALYAQQAGIPTPDVPVRATQQCTGGAVDAGGGG